jgi:hypothetical protein
MKKVSFTIPPELLGSPYRQELWKNAKKVIEKLEKVIPISEAYLLGSYTTVKNRPADVDFMCTMVG